MPAIRSHSRGLSFTHIAELEELTRTGPGTGRGGPSRVYMWRHSVSVPRTYAWNDPNSEPKEPSVHDLSKRPWHLVSPTPAWEAPSPISSGGDTFSNWSPTSHTPTIDLGQPLTRPTPEWVGFVQYVLTEFGSTSFHRELTPANSDVVPMPGAYGTPLDAAEFTKGANDNEELPDYDFALSPSSNNFPQTNITPHADSDCRSQLAIGLAPSTVRPCCLDLDTLYCSHIQRIPVLRGADPDVFFARFEYLPWPVLSFSPIKSLSALRTAGILDFYRTGPMARLSRYDLQRTARLWDPKAWKRRCNGKVPVKKEVWNEVRKGMKKVSKVVKRLAMDGER